MTGPEWAAVDRYLEERFLPADPVLEAALEDGQRAGLPSIQVSPLQGRLLYLLARLQGARRILEIGTLAGYSTIWLARALPTDGHLLSLELEPRHAAVARANLVRAGLADRASVRTGPAHETLADLVAEGTAPFDLIFLDADKEGYPEYLQWAIRLGRPGALLVADNVVRGGAIAAGPSTDPRVQAVQRFLDDLASDPRLCAVVVPMAGSKGYDGFALARIKTR